MSERICTVEGCEYSGQLRRSLCPRHYYQWKKTAESRSRCAVPDCDQSFYAKGYCTRHYNRFRLYGDPETPPQPRSQYETTGRIVHATGYVLIRVGPGDWRYEHRFVWEQNHGPIPDDHHVHHVNHDRSDNRAENLQLLEGREHNRLHTQARWRPDGDLSSAVRLDEH